MKKVLVSGYIGFNNFGDEAIFYALSTHLKELGYDVSVLCANKEIVEEKYDVKTYHFKKPFEILKAIFNCDILISGGGSLLQNKTSNFSLFYYLFIILLAKICAKKVIIFAQGIEPILGKIPLVMTKCVLKMVDFITVRDENSKKLLNSWNINSTLVSDPAYSLVQDRVINNFKNDLIVQLRTFKGIDEKFIKTLAFSIAKKYNGKVKVFSFQDEIDERICLEFLNELKKYGLDANYISAKSVEETIEIINSAQFVISTRLHGLIISNDLKSKTFAICYDDKIKTLTEELNLDSVDILNYNEEELDNKLDKFFENTSVKTRQFRRFDWQKIDESLRS